MLIYKYTRNITDKKCTGMYKREFLKITYYFLGIPIITIKKQIGVRD